MSNLFSDKSILVTGGAGSLGSRLVPRLLMENPRVIRIFDNNEHALFKLEEKFDSPKIRYLLGDVRDKDRLKRAIEDVEIVLHCSAYKIIFPYGEYDAPEHVKTNVLGTLNLVDAALNENVEKVIFMGTDKSAAPHNTYGASKLLAERIIISANYWKGKRRTALSVCRWGNVFNSEDSVVQIFKRQIQDGKPITITDPEATRFNITFEAAIDFIFRSLAMSRGTEIFIPKLKAYRVVDLAKALMENLGKQVEVKVVGLRTGEKPHEVLYTEYEAKTAVMFGPHQDYVILPDESTIKRFNLRFYLDEPVKFPESKPYGSEDAEKLSVEELKDLLKKEET